MKVKALIVAGSYRQYLDYLAVNKLDRYEYPYIYNSLSLLGHHDIKILKVGSYTSRVDWDEIRDRIRDINATNKQIQSS